MHTVSWACNCRAKANVVSWVPFSLPPWAIRGGFQMLSYVACVLFIVYRCGKKSSKQNNHEIPVASAVSILSATRFSFSSLRSRKYAAPWISSVSVACVLDDVSRNCSPGLHFPLLLYHIQIWPCSLKNLMSHFHSFFEISYMLTMYFNHILSCSSLWLLPDLSLAPSDFVFFYITARWVQSVLPVQAWMWGLPLERDWPTRGHNLKENSLFHRSHQLPMTP